ncbi:polymorphic toxin type 28 domain-containing protein [Lactiplantibacillus plantarum]|nr:polymorphic toxin type 28 domain-containing protein [Lactiplantibacillus plantarum]WQG54484.1 polymorphic toxin type 28 domain-containing protein [Lactiplantibacillus plantarum]
MTPAQKKSVNNNVADYLTDGDFSGTRRDSEEKTVPKTDAPGEYWNYLDEMLNTYKSIKSSKRRIAGFKIEVQHLND